MSAQFTIGALAKAAGVGVETIRYYQRRGLLLPPSRHQGAFGVYGEAEAKRLRFIRRAQTLGFSLDEISGLLGLNDATDREQARQLAKAKIADIDARLRQLNDMRDALSELVHCCEHTRAPSPCPILEALGSEPAVV